jgi:hypothetical protein
MVLFVRCSTISDGFISLVLFTNDRTYGVISLVVVLATNESTINPN